MEEDTLSMLLHTISHMTYVVIREPQRMNHFGCAANIYGPIE